MIFTDGPYLTKAEAERYYANLVAAEQQWKRVNLRDELSLARAQFKRRAIFAFAGLGLGSLLALLIHVR